MENICGAHRQLCDSRKTCEHSHKIHDDDMATTNDENGHFQHGGIDFSLFSSSLSAIWYLYGRVCSLQTHCRLYSNGYVLLLFYAFFLCFLFHFGWPKLGCHFIYAFGAAIQYTYVCVLCCKRNLPA